jgi:hypothetical protein
MFQTITFYHSLFRWLVLASLVYTIFRAYSGYVSKRTFGKTDNAARHWTATIAHIQLVIGMTIYWQSPLIRYFWASAKDAIGQVNITFFALIHVTLMMTAITLITIGSSLTKRRTSDTEKFRTMLIWYSIALLIIFIAVPWPFSPLASRPYFR